MIIEKRNSISLPKGVDESIFKVIHDSLNKITTVGNQFIVNDTPWFGMNTNTDLRPLVMNQAEYISKQFQNNLSEHLGWQGETTLAGQSFDGYGEIFFNCLRGPYKIKKDKIIDFINDYMAINQFPKHLFIKYFSIFYGKYILRDFFTLEEIPKSLHHYFYLENKIISKKIRVGIEFETGNVASSFRAFFKLNSLFQNDLIDLGVFITSTDKKNCSVRIWPASNRNGSFEELEKRNFQDNISLPLIEIGFRPDGFSRNVSYLHKDGSLYKPMRKNPPELENINGATYQVFYVNKKKVLKK